MKAPTRTHTPRHTHARTHARTHPHIHTHTHTHAHAAIRFSDLALAPVQGRGRVAEFLPLIQVHFRISFTQVSVKTVAVGEFRFHQVRSWRGGGGGGQGVRRFFPNSILK